MEHAGQRAQLLLDSGREQLAQRAIFGLELRVGGHAAASHSRMLSACSTGPMGQATLSAVVVVPQMRPIGDVVLAEDQRAGVAFVGEWPPRIGRADQELPRCRMTNVAVDAVIPVRRGVIRSVDDDAGGGAGGGAGLRHAVAALRRGGRAGRERGGSRAARRERRWRSRRSSHRRGSARCRACPATRCRAAGSWSCLRIRARARPDRVAPRPPRTTRGSS